MKLITKLTTLTVTLFIGSFLLLIFLVVDSEKEYLINQQNSYIKAISNTISNSIVEPILEIDYPEIDSVLENIAKEFEDIKSIKVIIDKRVVSKIEKKDNKKLGYFYSDVKIGTDIIATVEIGVSKERNLEIINERLLNLTMLIITFSILLCLVFIIILKETLIKKIERVLEFLNNKKLQNLDETLNLKGDDEINEVAKSINLMTNQLKNEIHENSLKDEILAQQSKMASMGDMISNIAHQWRQPLSAISSTASSIQLQKEMNVLDDEELIKLLDMIMKSSSYLSDTIETFRNFLKDGKSLRILSVKKIFETAFNIVLPSLKNSLIDVRIKHQNINQELKIISGELEQVIINILNNAKDIINEKKINQPWIEIETFISENRLTVTIEDNAGGIPQEILPKIFDAYFTTKHQSQGTGLGLHMSYKITTTSLKGKLYVKNSENGAKFYIEIPLS